MSYTPKNRMSGDRSDRSLAEKNNKRGKKAFELSNPLSTLAIAIAVTLGGVASSAFALSESASSDTSELLPIRFLQSLDRDGSPDSDGDGIRNQDDSDDDNDGILDSDEGRVDNDGDGIPDNNSVDTDGDGTPDVLDLDSDNDGIPDNVEGRSDIRAVQALDFVRDGVIDIGIDVGGNGIANVIETFTDSGELIYELPDTDGDGTPDFRDIDSDNDEIYDLVEAGGTDNDTDGRVDGFRDTDGMGVDNVIQANPLALYDTDGDGELDFRDVDSDGDSIADIIEGGSSRSFPTDTDGDGVPDYRENDSDGDGISDRREVGANSAIPTDSDGDGIPDFQDTDSSPDNGASGAENDGENNGENVDSVVIRLDDDNRPDRDDDGIANQDDLDDDNDGILDVEEGIVDADGNGVADFSSRDTDGDGVPDGNDLDSDNDGILDLVEARFDAGTIASLDPVRIGAISTGLAVGSNGVTDSIETSADSGVIQSALIDTDNDGVFDYLDTDSDGDGIGDLVEAGGLDVNSDGRIDGFVDADSKGVDDSVQASALPLFDTDGDGILDFRDTDSDNDGLPDSVESNGPLGAPNDSDADGAADYREQDSDNDGIDDAIEAGPDVNSPVDTDGNGVPDFQQGANGNDGGTPAPDPNVDTDGDGIANNEDADDDGDGLNDISEGSGDADSDGIINSLDLDSDNDGVLDSLEGLGDADGDGIANFLDLDSDNDGIYDALEASRGPINSSGRLATGEPDSMGRLPGTSGQLIDTDGDGVADRLDLDSDNDGLTDVLEALGQDNNLDARLDATVDANGDGADDSLTDRALQADDLDLDRIANYRDLDSDQDGVPDVVENFGAQFDQDNDGRIDNFLSADGDGLDDSFAAALSALRDTDRDGLPNSLDIDSDNDGISDLIEAGGIDINNDGRIDSLTDSDGDGIPDINDAGNTGGEDSDGDGIDDAFDVDFAGGMDSDADGVTDSSDPDSDGNGFAGPFDDGAPLGQGETGQLPDSDSDGVPDINQTTSSRAGVIETGLGGSGFGCSIAPIDSTASERRVDPMLAILFAASLLLLGLRRGKHR